KPEWYFVFMFQALKLVPGGEIIGIEYEAFAIMAFGLGGLLMLLVPFLDRGVEKTGKSPMFTLAGILALLFMIGMTVWGYKSLLPVWIVIGTVLLLLLVGWVTRPRDTREDR
ncbi:MAG: hypothetical protein ABR517_10050, partial [Thermoanaerobaculia bacterium]